MLTYNRLHPNQKVDVDEAVAAIVHNPTIDQAKTGDLTGVFVHKFKCNGQLTLLAYEYDEVSRFLRLIRLA